MSDRTSLLMRRMCGQKRRFATRAMARTAMRRRQCDIDGEVSVYRCPFCRTYHFGHTPGQSEPQR